MKNDIRLTEAAARDLAETGQYSLAEFGPASTADYLTGLREAFARLRDHPGIGVRRDDLRPEMRSLRYRSHRIYYRPSPDGIVILRVLHFARMVRREMLE